MYLTLSRLPRVFVLMCLTADVMSYVYNCIFW